MVQKRLIFRVFWLFPGNFLLGFPGAIVLGRVRQASGAGRRIAGSTGGFLDPLCNSCSSPDCSNPIQERSVSVVGRIQKNRLYVMSGNVVRQVVACKGYVGDAALPSTSLGFVPGTQ